MIQQDWGTNNEWQFFRTHVATGGKLANDSGGNLRYHRRHNLFLQLTMERQSFERIEA